MKDLFHLFLQHLLVQKSPSAGGAKANWVFSRLLGCSLCRIYAVQTDTPMASSTQPSEPTAPLDTQEQDLRIQKLQGEVDALNKPEWRKLSTTAEKQNWSLTWSMRRGRTSILGGIKLMLSVSGLSRFAGFSLKPAIVMI
jgi:hypothetical protein